MFRKILLGTKRAVAPLATVLALATLFAVGGVGDTSGGQSVDNATATSVQAGNHGASTAKAVNSTVTVQVVDQAQVHDTASFDKVANAALTANQAAQYVKIELATWTWGGGAPPKRTMNTVQV